MEADVLAYRESISNLNREDVIEASVDLYRKYRASQNKLTEIQNSSHEMIIQYQQMQMKVDAIQKECDILREQNQHLTNVQKLSTKSLFGRGTEKKEDLLGRAKSGEKEEDPLDEDALEGTSEENPNPPENKEPNDPSSGKKNPKKPKTSKTGRSWAGKRQRDLSKLPRQVIYDYDIEEFDREYGEGAWRFSFWTEEKTIETMKAITYVKVVYRPILSVGLSHHMVRPYMKNSLFPKSLASASLVSRIMTDKLNLFLPTYRQEHDKDRFGFPLSRQTMTNWINQSCDLFLKKVYDYLCDRVRLCKYQQCDETYYTVIQDGRPAGTNSYFWVHRTSELLDGPRMVVFCYEKTRHSDHLRKFYKGVEHLVYLTCDAYSAYECFAGDPNEPFVICGCFMHARRRYAKAFDLLDTSSLTDEQIHQLPEIKGLDLIGEIYQADEALKELDAEERLAARQLYTRPKVEAYFDFVDHFDTEDPLVSEKLKDAIQYSRNQKEELMRFLEDGNIPIDDGATERSIRPVAQGRRNYLFSYSIKGAESTGIATTVIQTAKENGADPFYYIKFLLEELPRHGEFEEESYLSELMPWTSRYREYEDSQKKQAISWMADKKTQRPRTPQKRRRQKEAS